MNKMQQKERKQGKFQHLMYMTGLVLAGESIYMLPYLRRTFHTSMEQVFGLGSMQVGLLNTMFGILAVACYFPSGWLADRISARRLLTFSLAATSAGGFYMLTLPSYRMLLILHAFWGVTSILTFWAALIKATRNWGNPANQGTSFGLLDGGRGVIAALLASLATTAFAMSGNTEEGLKQVLLIYSIAPLVAAVIIWLVIPDHQYQKKSKVPMAESRKDSGLKKVMALPQVWLLAIIIFCAYMLYLGSFDFPAYAERAYGQTKTFGAILGTIRDWMRPIAALGAGLLADKIRPSRAIQAAFFLLIISFGAMAVMEPSASNMWVLWIQVILSALAVFALRGVYFATMEETGVPKTLTGTTVGIVSFIGFAPDIFAHTLSGWFVDTYGLQLGYRYYFSLLSAIALMGLITALQISKFRSAHIKKIVHEK